MRYRQCLWSIFCRTSDIVTVRSPRAMRGWPYCANMDCNLYSILTTPVLSLIREPLVPRRPAEHIKNELASFVRMAGWVSRALGPAMKLVGPSLAEPNQPKPITVIGAGNVCARLLCCRKALGKYKTIELGGRRRRFLNPC